MVKQIAGRAGRRNSIYPEGFTTTLHAEDHSVLVESLTTTSTPITAAGLFPNPEQLVAFSAQLAPRTPLPDVISEFMTASMLEGPYFMCRAEDLQATASLLQRYSSISIETRAMMCLIPSNLRKAEVRSYFFNFVDQYVSGVPVRLNMQLPINDPAWYSLDSESLETKAQALDAYLWLHMKFGSATFVDYDDAVQKRAIVSVMLEDALMRISASAKDSERRRSTPGYSREYSRPPSIARERTTRRVFL